MLRVKVIKAIASRKLEEEINNFLEDLDEDKFVEIKLAGANNGKDETFLAVITYKA